MKLLTILLIFISVPVYAEQDCIFNEAAYTEFIKKYATENKNSKISPDGKSLVVNRDNEEIIIKGGGCVHMGVAIELKSQQVFTEKQFLQKTLELATEFGGWLINTRALQRSIKNGDYQIINGSYFINVNAMTIFEAYHDSQGKINVDFYIN